jgi:superfamily I DNA/RNA helicase
MTYPDPEQQQILDHLHGTLLVLAPAGTDKTRLMADRLAAAIAAGMPPEKTLGVTFTNRAKEHMRVERERRRDSQGCATLRGVICRKY